MRKGNIILNTGRVMGGVTTLGLRTGASGGVHANLYRYGVQMWEAMVMLKCTNARVGERVSG